MDDNFIKSLEELANQAEKAQTELSKMNGTHTYNLNEIFPPSFMKAHTAFNSFNSFLEKCGITNQRQFDAYPHDKLDEKVKEKTSFSSYEDMFNTALKAYISNRTGIDISWLVSLKIILTKPTFILFKLTS